MPILEDTVGQFVPQWSFTGIFSIGAWLILIVIFGAICTAVTIFIILRMRYKYKIVIWEKVNGRFEITGRDKAMEMPLSRFGETVFYLQKRKKYLPRPNKQVGRKMFFFFVREDGQWINVDMEDLDEKAKKLRIHFTDKSMNYARTQIERALKERYDKPSFFERYGTVIVSIVFVVILGILVWLLFDKWLELARVTNAGVEMSGKVTEKITLTLEQLNRVLSAMDNICQGGSGMVRA